ncbi:MAG: DUF5666 domain-containing protein [Anaerolineae bacterium]
MKKLWIGIGAGLLVLAVAGGSFWGGTVYGRLQASRTAQRFFQEGFGDRAGQFPGGQFPSSRGTRQAGQGNAFSAAGGVVGTIQSIEGQTLTLESTDGTIKVETTDTTLIEKTMPVTIDDLEVDEQVIVMGRENDDGSITARSILPLRAPQFGQPAGGE